MGVDPAASHAYSVYSRKGNVAMDVLQADATAAEALAKTAEDARTANEHQGSTGTAPTVTNTGTIKVAS